MELVRIAKKNKDVLILFIFSLLFFTYLIRFVRTDIISHLLHVENINDGLKEYPANFAYYFLINILSGFSSIWKIKILNAILVLSTATVFKYLISKRIIIKLNESILGNNSTNKVTLIALSLFFCYSIPDPFSIFVLEQFYLGRFVPTAWQNSTTIFLFPFAILLFWKQLKVLHSSYELKIPDILVLNTLVIANAIIKPSFLFVYIPVTSLFLLSTFKNSSRKEFLWKLSPIVMGMLVIFLQKYLIYDIKMGSIQETDSSIAIGFPFKTLVHWIPAWYIPISFLLSYALPIYAIIAYKNILKYKPFLFSISLAIAGILLSAFVYETGPRMYHGNFMWQNIICCYLIFLSTISFLTPTLLDKNSWTRKDKIMVGLLILHFLSGILYLIRIGITLKYA